MALCRSWSVQSGLKGAMCLLTLSHSRRKEDGRHFGFFPSSFLIAHEIGKDFPTRQGHQFLEPIELRKTYWNDWLQEALDGDHRTGRANISVRLGQHFQHWGWRKGRGGEGMELPSAFTDAFTFSWKISLIWFFLYFSCRYPLAFPYPPASQLGPQRSGFPTDSPHLKWLFLFLFSV